MRHDATDLDDVGGRHHSAVVSALLVTKREAATMLGVSVRTVERLIASGRLPVVHVEGASRIRVNDLNAFVEGLPSGHSIATSDQQPSGVDAVDPARPAGHPLDSTDHTKPTRPAIPSEGREEGDLDDEK